MQRYDKPNKIRVSALLGQLFKPWLFSYAPFEGQQCKIRARDNWRTSKKLGSMGMIVLLLVLLAGCQANTNKDTKNQTVSSQKSVSSVISKNTVQAPSKVESLPVTSAEFTKQPMNATIPDSEVNQPFMMSFYDGSDMKGRGLRDNAGEPYYVGVNGYAVVYVDANLESESEYNNTPWTVPVYIKDNGDYVLNGKINHKVKIEIIGQELKKQNGREYEGFLEFQELETGRVGYINVKNFVTIPYWNQDVSQAVATGYGIAVFEQSSKYTPVYKDGEAATVKKGTQVLLPARGTYYVSTMNRVDYQIVGIVFETKNNTIEPQYIFFNKNDLSVIY